MKEGFKFVPGLDVRVIILFTATKKVLEVSGGDTRNSISLPLTRIKTEESKRFIDLVSNAIIKH